MTFNEENAVENFIRDSLCGKQAELAIAETGTTYQAGRDANFPKVGISGSGAGWHFAPAITLPRQPQDVFVEPFVREALIRLNPSIAADPNRQPSQAHRGCSILWQWRLHHDNNHR